MDRTSMEGVVRDTLYKAKTMTHLGQWELAHEEGASLPVDDLSDVAVFQWMATSISSMESVALSLAREVDALRARVAAIEH